jgi:TolB protein
LLYSVSNDGGQQLVLADLEGNLTHEVTDYDQKISFSLSPTNDRVAYVVSPANAPTAAFGPLYVVDLANNRTRQLSGEPAMAFFWSPDGSKLAYIVIDDSGEVLRLRWHVWNGATMTSYAPFVPSRTFLQGYITFFDQYARSMSIWSPDSAAFTYAATDEETGSNIWVQSLEASEPVRVSRGVFAAWSPR